MHFKHGLVLIAQTIHFGCQLGVFGGQLHKNYNQKLPRDNQHDSILHFLAMSCDGQVATYDFNGQVFF